ncbi:MAG: transglycosylase SLT domain-containing protein [Chitinivibrionales bacterium]|nr:transglycosylase SLT domain-containing protein [Chitinivibrionales bacterium]
MSYYYFEIIKGIECGRRYLLQDGAISIGRSSQNAVVMHAGEKTVSGHHSIVYKTGESILLQDMDSTNGTFCNEERTQEKQLAEGDVIGFGKFGPRLKVLISENELDTEYNLDSSQGDFASGSTNARTLDDAGKARRSHHQQEPDQTADTDRMKGENISIVQPEHDPFADPPSHTMEMERKLVEKRMDSADMHQLMRSGKRMEKILDRGQLGQTQTGLLRAAYQANRKMRGQWRVILGVVIAVSLVVSSFFAIRSFQYKRLIDNGLSIDEMMDNLEKRIAEERRGSNDPEKLKALIAELENKQNDMQEVKSQINAEDFGKFYDDPMEEALDKIFRRLGETEYHIPPMMIERVKHHVDIFSGRMHRTVERYLIRKDKYFPMILKALKESRLPLELAYVSMLESGFNPKALSHAGARGLWQFMPATARRYGLKVNNSVDERIIPEKATRAAMEYFKDLIAIFGGKSSVMLAMAAYNAGEGRIMGALRKIDDPMRNRDFWYIYRLGCLAEETNEYIPKVLSLMIIAENPAKYGFDIQPAATAVRNDEIGEADHFNLDFGNE